MTTKEPEQSANQRQRVKLPVPPEIAALVREEHEAHAATVGTAQAVANAAVASASAAIATSNAKRIAAMRPILRQLNVDEGEIVGTEGYGASTVLIVEIPNPSESSPAIALVPDQPTTEESVANA